MWKSVFCSLRIDLDYFWMLVQKCSDSPKEPEAPAVGLGGKTSRLGQTPIRTCFLQRPIRPRRYLRAVGDLFWPLFHCSFSIQTGWQNIFMFIGCSKRFRRTEAGSGRFSPVLNSPFSPVESVKENNKHVWNTKEV
jgi:hypothetical protein